MKSYFHSKRVLTLLYTDTSSRSQCCSDMPSKPLCRPSSCQSWAQLAGSQWAPEGHSSQQLPNHVLRAQCAGHTGHMCACMLGACLISKLLEKDLLKNLLSQNL